MTYPKAIVIAAALIAGALVWQGADAQDRTWGQGSGDWGQGPGKREVKAVVAGQMVWWLESTSNGPQVSACEFDGIEINCRSKPLNQ